MALPNIDSAHEVGGSGLLVTLDNTRLVWLGSGADDPSVSPGIAAPLGSMYIQTNGTHWHKTGPSDLGWEQAGLGNGVSTQNADFGKTGVATANSYLNRAGNVPSNVSGIPIMLSECLINAVSAANQNIDTYDVEIWQHEGDFTNAVLKHTISVVAARSTFDVDLAIPVDQGKQLAAKVLSSVQNVGVTVGMKGLAE